MYVKELKKNYFYHNLWWHSNRQWYYHVIEIREWHRKSGTSIRYRIDKWKWSCPTLQNNDIIPNTIMWLLCCTTILLSLTQSLSWCASVAVIDLTGMLCGGVITVYTKLNKRSQSFILKPASHTSPRQNPAILLCLRGVATPMCYEKTTRSFF